MNSILALDCATNACSVALNLNGEYKQILKTKARIHNRILLPMIDRLLSQAGLRPKDLDLLVCGIGPGAFMGVRIAVAAAQGLATAADLPLIPISSLYALAQQAWRNQVSKPFKGGILTLLDARLSQVYWGCYEEYEKYEADKEPKRLLKEKISPQLAFPAEVNPPIDIALGIGEGWNYQAKLPSPLRELKEVVKDGMPQARHLIEVALSQKHPLIYNPRLLSPLYLRNQISGRF